RACGVKGDARGARRRAWPEPPAGRRGRGPAGRPRLDQVGHGAARRHAECQEFRTRGKITRPSCRAGEGGRMRAPMTGSGKRLRWLAAGLLVLVAVPGLLVAYRGTSLRDVPPLGPTALTLVPGVHLLGRLEPSAAYVVETPEGLVLIDAGLDE